MLVPENKSANYEKSAMNITDKKAFAEGLSLLKRPVLPLVNMVQFLYLTGPFATIEDVLARLTKAVELAGIRYGNPQETLKPYADILKEFAVLKGKKKLTASLPFIVDEKNEPVAKRQALELWIKQHVLSRELERINSLLCKPCGCVLCCTGPNSEFDEASGYKGVMKQEYFEIPLEESEADLFALPRVDTPDSRSATARSEPPLQIDNAPFYKQKMALYHWKNGWGLILPAGAVCPQLAADTKRCTVYEKRPQVCRKPQIFAYILEKTPDTAKRSDGVLIPVYMARSKVLAVWDCPYVRKFQDEIGAYAEMGGLEPVFKKSKI
ncbi:MAG: YkgJ family cysteine cluster protein [Desulfobulbales bacterium]|nr:YkgJ family cysteine cluster protein [Desulfobulbales bacterium]